jgi:soluble lytic murein transglycosylase-like protein
MKKIAIFSAKIIALSAALFVALAVVHAEKSGERKLIRKTVVDSVSGSIDINSSDHKNEPVSIIKLENKPEADDENQNKRPFIKDIPLSDEILDYLWEKCEENDISYTLVLAIIKQESNFNVNSTSKTKDFGLMQIHNSTGKWIAEELGIENVDFHDYKQNIDIGIWYLKNLRDSWREKGLSEEQVFNLTVISFHRGVEGTYNYIKKNGYNDPYLRNIKKYKYEFEQNMGEEN